MVELRYGRGMRSSSRDAAAAVAAAATAKECE